MPKSDTNERPAPTAQAVAAAKQALLPGLPIDAIVDCYSRAAGNEISTGKFASPESSSALVANAFGAFLEQPQLLPALPGCEATGWPASRVELEAVVRFPWSGGMHPHLDVIVATGRALIGIESKRYEPYRTHNPVDFSIAYRRQVWGDNMARYERLRDQLSSGDEGFSHLDAAQLVKHAFGLRTEVNRRQNKGHQPILFYLYAEPILWPDGRDVAAEARHAHRIEIAKFADLVEGDEVQFRSCTYRQLLAVWRDSGNSGVQTHAVALAGRFAL